MRNRNFKKSTVGTIDKKLLIRADKEDQYAATIDAVERGLAFPERMRPENLAQIVNYFDDIESEATENVVDYFSELEKIESGARKFFEGSDDDLIKACSDVGFNVGRLKGLEKYLAKFGLPKYALNSVVLIKVLKVVLSNLKEAEKIIEQAYAQGAIEEEVVDALTECAIVKWENDDGKKDKKKKKPSFKSKFSANDEEDEDDAFSGFGNRGSRFGGSSFGGSSKFGSSGFGGSSFGSSGFGNSGFGSSGFGSSNLGGSSSKFGSSGFGGSGKLLNNGKNKTKTKTNPFKR